MRHQAILALFTVVGVSAITPYCQIGDKCDECLIKAELSTKCSAENGEKELFMFCNPRSKKIDVDPSSYLYCNMVWRQKSCSDDGRTHFSMLSKECIDPASMTYHAQGTSGSGRVGDVCSFNTDCLGGMYCAIGQCRCLSTYIAVDAYCYEKISPSESGCFYDVQCAAVWPDAFCRGGQCLCPSEDMIAVKTKYSFCKFNYSRSNYKPSVKDGTVCVWSTGSEPACPLPSLPPPDSPAALVVLPALAGKNTVSIASCNPHSSMAPPNEEMLNTKPYEYKCAAKGNPVGNSDEPQPIDVSDLYDCIDNAKFWKEQGVDVSHPVGVCCMNRACPRGNPAYLSAKSHLGQIPHTGCTITHPCPDPYVCAEVASQSMCCPSRKSICSEGGGRLKDSRRSTPYDAGLRFDQLTGEQANYALGISTRYYYNPTDGQCHPFTYNGFLGNFNNFINQADCQIFCSRLQCAHGNPLTNGNGTPQRCQRDAETLCTEPLRIGDCKQSVRQFWYNAEIRTCEPFQYTGCQGNNNRFNSLNECQSYCKNINAEPKCPQGRAYVDFSGKFLQCGDGLGTNICPANFECTFDGLVHGCCPSKAYTCSLQLSKGVACGSGSSYRYYYNNQAKECQSFLFMGCDGNSNNFPSAEKCQNYCEIAVCPNGGTPLRTNSKVRSCSSIEPCPSGYDCSVVDSNGVTTRRCCPSKVSICSKPPQMGLLPKCSSGTGQIRYYFNMALQTCSSYTSNGCDTSLNSFNTLQECEDFCWSSGCTLGDTVYKDPNSNRPFICNTALQNNCPSSYDCVLNSLTQEHVCCGSESMGVCPTGEKAFMDPRTNAPRQCAMAADGKCPANFLCRFSQTNHKYYCCGSVSGAMCPSGRALFRYATTQLPLQCHISPVSNTCPPGYSCLSDVPGAFQGYCCSTHPLCPREVQFHIDDKTLMPTTCSSEGFAYCPQGFTCQQQPETTSFYCCSGVEKGAVNDGCPPGQYAYILPSNEAQTCDPFNPGSLNGAICPPDYTCQWSLNNQKYQCCGTRPLRPVKPSIIDDGCPHKQFALLDRRTNQSRICTAGEESSCPKGFFCQFSAKRGQFQCCGQSGGCPRGRAAFIAIDGNAQECLPGPNMCQDGYECMKSSIANKNICCSEEANECADNEQLINGSCVISVKPGGACQKSEECAGGSSCIDHTCTCPPEKIVQKDKCVDKECTANQIRIDGICVDRADIGQACKSSLQCVANSHCISGRCDCSKDEKVENNKCVKKKKGEESEETNKKEKEKEKEKENSGSGSSETDEKLESEDKK
ncbi:hypothetical protein WR25_25636 isoform D [Diploscapter pachys]|nr:hypothetical protein WR25_25636 isoform B [Diploscapter pachys]PAV74635.1 hypothetical protein WR25_25636 isoform D [Diploscapter pachys]